MPKIDKATTCALKYSPTLLPVLPRPHTPFRPVLPAVTL
jgi:hypothetical protein